MNQKIKEQWVSALRSGNYQQGREALKKGDQYCCLGVLCDLHRKATKKKGWEPDSRSLESVQEVYKGLVDYLPEVVVKWAGLASEDPLIDGMSLSARNDVGEDFSEIADLIEEEL